MTLASSATSVDGAYEFQPEDRPLFAGGPFTPPHPALRRLGYAAIGTWAGAMAAFANATVAVNVGNLSGEYGLYVAEASWLPALYVAANACSNTVLVKARARFGMPDVMRVLLAVYAVVSALQFVVPSFGAAAVERFASGAVAGGMTTTSIFYLMQSMPPRARPLALLIGLGLVQLETPLARLLPVDLLCAQGWTGQHCIELAVPLVTLALLTLLPLPPTPRSHLFEPLDFVCVCLLLPAMVLICGVLNRGRLAWWTDTPWLGIDLALAIPLLTAFVLIEWRRERPLIRVRWFGARDFLAFIAVALLMRLNLSEQTYGAVGLLSSAGLDDDQLRVLFGCVVLGMVAGIAACALTFSERAIPWQVIVASLAIALGAWMDVGSSNVTRPEQMYLSQALVGFGTCLFIGPTMARGILNVLRLGPEYLVTLVVVFSTTQNVGGLAGTAMLGSYQTIASRQHVEDLARRAAVGDAQVSGRVQRSARSFAREFADPKLRSQQGAASLAASLAREANVLAYDDLFRLVSRLALGGALFVGAWMTIPALRPKRRNVLA